VLEPRPHLGAGLHYVCPICGHPDNRLQANNWIDYSDPGEEREFGLGHEQHTMLKIRV
jgi:hypothetical protein